MQVRRLKKPVGNSWRMDENYIKVNGAWVYLYRAVDSSRNTIEFLLRKNRDSEAAGTATDEMVKKRVGSLSCNYEPLLLAITGILNGQPPSSPSSKYNTLKYLYFHYF